MLRHFSLRGKLGTAVVLVGALMLVLAVVTAKAYEYTILSNDRTLIEESIAREAQQAMDQLRAELTDLAFALQSEQDFQRAAGMHDRPAVSALLGRQFQRYFATEGIIRLVRIAMFDPQLAPLGSATDALLRGNDAVACVDLLAAAGRRSAIDRLRVASGLCSARNQAYFALLTPMGGLHPRGYLLLEVDPIPALAPLESELATALRITSPDGNVLWQSATWPSMAASDNVLFATHTLNAAPDQAVLRLHAAMDVGAMRARLDFMLHVLLVAAVLLTIGFAVLTRRMLARNIARPLEKLRTHVELLHTDRTNLGRQVEISGDDDIERIAAGVNLMSKELMNLHGTLNYMAFTDPLTHLPNRLQLHGTLDKLIALCRDHNLPFALFLISIDSLRQVNQSFGYDAGDALLRNVAMQLRDRLRTTDFVSRVAGTGHEQIADNVARLGDCEFAALLPEVANANQALSAAENALTALRGPHLIEGHRVAVEASIGIAMYPWHGADASTLLRNADGARNAARRDGGGARLFNADGEILVGGHFELERDLRQALARGQLSLHYQPEVEPHSRRVRRAEALMRWHHHNQDRIPPDLFIPLAEQIGMLHDLTTWAIEQAIHDCSRWRAAGHDFGVAVNVTPQCITTPDFAGNVAHQLRRWGLTPALLTLEITERHHHSEIDRIAARLDALAQTGVRIAIDDFGAGYPTLAQLRSLPAHQIKIDRSFITGLATDAHDAAVVRAAVDIARQRGMEIVAEGVETEETWTQLAALGVDTAQGYYIARPMPLADLLTWFGSTGRSAA